MSVVEKLKSLKKQYQQLQEQGKVAEAWRVRSQYFQLKVQGAF